MPMASNLASTVYTGISRTESYGPTHGFKFGPCLEEIIALYLWIVRHSVGLADLLQLTSPFLKMGEQA